MKNFFDRFKPENAKKTGFSLKLPGQNSTFSGQGQSLGGGVPGKVISVQLDNPGPLGLGVEKRPGSNTAIVSKVVPGSQAEQAGLERGDVLCFAGSQGQEEILYDMFLELAKSDQRPLCFEVRRVKTKSNSQHEGSADAYARKQAVIAAAEARERAAKQKSKGVTRKTEAPKVIQPSEIVEEPQSEAAKAAVLEAKNKEAALAAELGYNPYETNKVTAGQARNATVAVTHGTISKSDSADAPIPAVRPPTDALDQAKERLPPSPDFAQAFETVVTANDQKSAVSSIAILRKLIVNATTKGQESSEDAPKFRKVRLANPKIRAAVVDVTGAIDVMLSVGFLLHEENGESVLIYPADTNGPEWLETALEQLEKYEKS